MSSLGKQLLLKLNFSGCHVVAMIGRILFENQQILHTVASLS